MKELSARLPGEGQTVANRPLTPTLSPQSGAREYRARLLGGGLERRGQPRPLGGAATMGKVEAIKIHHLVPSSHEVTHERLLRVVASIDFREGAQLRVRTEDQVYAGAGPLDLVCLPVAPLIEAFRVRGRLPLRAHVEQVDEEVICQRLGPLGKDAVRGLPGI